jgi:hypothetical protein
MMIISMNTHTHTMVKSTSMSISMMRIISTDTSAAISCKTID